MAYKIDTEVFKGPFDLLLHLVRINEMDIYDIALSEITEKYLEAIRTAETVDLGSAGDFLVMAATLINIKSRTLMPPRSEEEAEEEEEVDEEYENIRDAQDLMRRLIEYRQFKELGSRLSIFEEQQTRVFYRNSILPSLTRAGENEEEEDGTREDINLLFSAFARVLQFADGRPAHHVVEEEFSVEEKVEAIKSRLNMDRRIGLKNLFRRCVNKQEMITTFLALLELCKMKLARVRQRHNYSDIELVLASEPLDDDED